MDHITLLIIEILLETCASRFFLYPCPSLFTLPTTPGSRPEVDQIRQLQRALSDKERENRELKERIKELESAGQRTEESCQCLPKPPNATGLVASKV